MDSTSRPAQVLRALMVAVAVALLIALATALALLAHDSAWAPPIS